MSLYCLNKVLKLQFLCQRLKLFISRLARFPAYYLPVILIPWYQVYMKMKDCLSGSLAVILHDVVAVNVKSRSKCDYDFFRE